MNLRLFIAIEPPEAVRRRLAAMQGALKRQMQAPEQPPGGAEPQPRRPTRSSFRPPKADEVKWVAPEGIHLTLQFLGAVPEERVERITAALSEAAAGARPLHLEVKGAGGFPNARRPRVLWAGVAGDVEPLAALVADLGRRLAPLGYPPEERAFSPHLTLGRARDQRGVPGLAGGLAQLSSEEGTIWRATEVCLFRSHLSPAGARYEVIARAPLGPARPSAE